MAEYSILIGNTIAFVAAIFTVLSSLSKKRYQIYGYQLLQCLCMAIASVFFFSLSGVTTFLLCALRNYYLARDSFTKNRCIVFALLVGILGLVSNNRGIPGLLPVVTTLIYTIGSYLLRTEKMIKMNIALNLFLWSVYDLFILDIVSMVIDGISVVVTLYAIVRINAAGHDSV